MRSLANRLLALVLAIVAALYWIAVAQIAFSLTGTDPIELVRTGAIATTGGVGMIAVLIGALLAHALASREYFRISRMIRTAMRG